MMQQSISWVRRVALSNGAEPLAGRTAYDAIYIYCGNIRGLNQRIDPQRRYICDDQLGVGEVVHVGTCQGFIYIDGRDDLKASLMGSERETSGTTKQIDNLWRPHDFSLNYLSNFVDRVSASIDRAMRNAPEAREPVLPLRSARANAYQERAKNTPFRSLSPVESFEWEITSEHVL
jgi:hypothetical protein